MSVHAWAKCVVVPLLYVLMLVLLLTNQWWAYFAVAILTLWVTKWLRALHDRTTALARHRRGPDEGGDTAGRTAPLKPAPPVLAVGVALPIPDAG